MIKRFISKLKNKAGVSLASSLLLFMVCTIGAAAIMAPLIADAAKNRGAAREQQKYFTLRSALSFGQSLLNGNYTGGYNLEKIVKPVSEMLTVDEGTPLEHMVEVPREMYIYTLTQTAGDYISDDGRPMDAQAAALTDFIRQELDDEFRRRLAQSAVPLIDEIKKEAENDPANEYRFIVGDTDFTEVENTDEAVYVAELANALAEGDGDTPEVQTASNPTPPNISKRVTTIIDLDVTPPSAPKPPSTETDPNAESVKKYLTFGDAKPQKVRLTFEPQRTNDDNLAGYNITAKLLDANGYDDPYPPLFANLELSAGRSVEALSLYSDDGSDEEGYTGEMSFELDFVKRGDDNA